MILLFRQVAPQRLHNLVCTAGIQHDSDNRQCALGVSVHEVGHHLGRLAVNPLLAWMMEMELDELVAPVADPEDAPRFDVDLDAVAVVDDVQRRGSVVENQLWQVLAVNIPSADIDRRLPPAAAARAIMGVQCRPVRWAAGAGIGPMMRRFASQRCCARRGN